LALALIVNLFEKYRTLNLDEILKLVAQEVTVAEAAPTAPAAGLKKPRKGDK
jgi:ribosomal protein L12E/L44/L45/RPP1/RPP2